MGHDRTVGRHHDVWACCPTSCVVQTDDKAQNELGVDRIGCTEICRLVWHQQKSDGRPDEGFSFSDVEGQGDQLTGKEAVELLSYP